jgi:hypothetical protein
VVNTQLHALMVFSPIEDFYLPRADSGISLRRGFGLKYVGLYRVFTGNGIEQRT